MVLLDCIKENVRRTVLGCLQKARFGVVDVVECEEAGVLPHAVVTELSEGMDVSRHVQGLRSRWPDAALIGLIGPGPRATARLLVSFRAGVIDAVLEADTSTDLVPTLKLAVERKRLEMASAETSDIFTHELGHRARSLSKAYENIELAYEETIEALVRALDVREEATAGHSVRVAYYTCYLAHLMGFRDEHLKDVYRGAILHDIGKIGIPDAILLKPGKLTEDEFEIMKTHTSLARDFLQDVGYLERATDIPFCHHEKWNGKGYPQGLSENDIPLSARVFAVADVYDALRSVRCYKPAFDHEKSFGIITEDSGTHFDPRVVELFIEQPVEIWERLNLASRCENPSYAKMLEVFAGLALEGAPMPVGAGGGKTGV